MYRRRRRATALTTATVGDSVQARAPPALVSFPCPGCGKNLRAKAELAGKKLKCPHCGQPVTVPEAAATAASAAPEDRDQAKPSGWLGSMLLLLSVVAAAGLGIVIWTVARNRVGAAEGAPPDRTRLAFDFRKKVDDLPGVTLFGPDADSVAKTDAQGLRITLPEGRSDCRNVGVELPLRIHGDFEIDLGYELLAFGENIPNPAAGVQ